MFRNWLREYYMLGRGEQRALLLLAAVLLLSLAVRVMVQLLPAREPPGMAAFMEESRQIMAEMERRDSLEKADSARGSHGAGSGDQPAHAFIFPEEPRHRGPVDINRADSAQLISLPGIGPVFSGRIIRYRNLLGGYASVHQLLEVYGLPRETFDRIRGSVLIDTTAICRLGMNGSSFSDLLRHPYLDYEDVKALVRYRDFRGKIGSVQEIRENHLLVDSTLERMIPYMNFDR